MERINLCRGKEPEGVKERDTAGRESKAHADYLDDCLFLFNKFFSKNSFTQTSFN